jgi:hypothetical protein
MRRLLAWIVGLSGGLAVYRLVARRRGTVELEPSAPVPEIDPRAEALRVKLDESRAATSAAPEAPVPPPPSGETVSETTGGADGDPDERRQAVYEHGRAAAQEMRGAARASEEPQ